MPDTETTGGRLSAQHWRAIFAAGQRDRRDFPNSVAATDVSVTPRIAMPSPTWTLLSDDRSPPSYRAASPRPFWLSDRGTDIGFMGGLRRVPVPAAMAIAHPPAVVPLPAPVVRQVEPKPAPAIAPDMRRLIAVNSQVNRSLRRSSDRQTFGQADFWATPQDGATSGDCEDFVLAKRHALIQAGVPAGAMSIALVRTRRGEMHAVLLVATAGQEVVLDNLSPWVLPWHEAPYTWLNRQLPGSAQWARVAQSA